MNSTVHLEGCVICGTPTTHQHHIVKRRLGGVETISLCPKHHVWADKGKIPTALLWTFLRERANGLELVEESEMEMCWELDYHRDVMMYPEVKYHDFYNSEYSRCLYPPSLDPENHRVHRQCMVSLWLEGKRELDISLGHSPLIKRLAE